MLPFLYLFLLLGFTQLTLTTFNISKDLRFMRVQFPHMCP